VRAISNVAKAEAGDGHGFEPSVPEVMAMKIMKMERSG
jgi:hypothetical protein